MDNVLLIMLLRQLIEDQRLTGVTPDVKLDGTALLAAGDDHVEPVPHASQWDETGASIELSEFGGQQIKGVEDLRAQLLRSGDARDAKIAQALPQFYVRMTNIDQFDDRQEYIARENHNRVFVSRMFGGLGLPAVALLSDYTPRFYKKGTQEPVWGYTPDLQTVDRAHRIKTAGLIPNHRIVAAKQGEDMAPERITAWANKFVDAYRATGDTPVDDSWIGGDRD
jgi:hypothetical protein